VLKYLWSNAKDGSTLPESWTRAVYQLFSLWRHESFTALPPKQAEDFRPAPLLSVSSSLHHNGCCALKRTADDYICDSRSYCCRTYFLAINLPLVLGDPLLIMLATVGSAEIQLV
jgi:hypothetical protein